MAPKPGVSHRQTVIRRNGRPLGSLMTDGRWAEAWLSFLLVLDIAADNVGDVGVFFFLFLDKGRIVETLVDLDVFFDIRLRGLDRALGARRLGVSVLEETNSASCGSGAATSSAGAAAARCAAAAAWSGRERDVGRSTGTTLPV